MRVAADRNGLFAVKWIYLRRFEFVCGKRILFAQILIYLRKIVFICAAAFFVESVYTETKSIKKSPSRCRGFQRSFLPFNPKFRFLVEEMRAVHVESHIDRLPGLDVEPGIDTGDEILVVYDRIKDDFRTHQFSHFDMRPDFRFR